MLIPPGNKAEKRSRLGRSFSHTPDYGHLTANLNVVACLHVHNDMLHVHARFVSPYHQRPATLRHRRPKERSTLRSRAGLAAS